MKVHRIYVERKYAYAIEAKQLADELRKHLGISRLESLRILNRYEVEGISSELFERCKAEVFSTPGSDIIFESIPDSHASFAVMLIPGQYDQRADSCAQCIEIISCQKRPIVKTARIFLLYGSLSNEDIANIKNYLINPLSHQEAFLNSDDPLSDSREEPLQVALVYGFIDMTDKELKQYLSDENLTMDLEDLKLCQEYFQSQKRNPTVTEIRTIDTYWSDHCRHTTFHTRIENCNIADERVRQAYDRYIKMRKTLKLEHEPITLMDIATIGAKYMINAGELTELDVSDEVNACSVHTLVDVNGEKQPWLLMFKNETHNHPTEIEPYGGAATCIGGAIRDPLSGRGYAYQGMRIAGTGNPLTPVVSTQKGKLPQRKLSIDATEGFSNYSNQIGLATGISEQIFHPGYVAKHMELGAVLAAAPTSNVKRAKPVKGDIIVLLGGKTGRDGIGGATGSSKSHSADSLVKSGAEVQRGNPPEERKIQRLFRNEKAARLIKRCNDFGAGGAAVAIGELANGVSIELDKIPVKYAGLDGTELALSESQERMALVISPEDLNEFMELADYENLESTPVAEIIEEPRIVMKWQGETIVDICYDFLNSNGNPKYAQVSVKKENSSLFSKHDLKTSLHDPFNSLLADLNICSKKGLLERFDSTVGAGTVLMPLGGLYQTTPIQAMVAKFPVLSGDTTSCSAMAFGFNPFISSQNPYKGAYLAVVESVAKIVAAGASSQKCYLSFQEYFEKLGDDPLRWGKPFSALLGALDAQMDLNVAAVGGKDSMSGSFEDLHVPPTLVSFAVSLCDVDNVISPEFKSTGSAVFLLSPVYDELGLPKGKSMAACFEYLENLIREKKVRSAFALSHGGMAEAIFKMCIGNRLGFTLSHQVDQSELFDLRYGSFLLEADDSVMFSLHESSEINIKKIGVTKLDYSLRIGDEVLPLSGLEKSYNGGLASVYPFSSENGNETPLISFREERYMAPAIKILRPKALIPVFPGTNCEYDTAAALEKAGANAEIFVVRNLTTEAVIESINAMAYKISKSNIIVFPGGSSFGDEPDGSGKSAAAFIRNDKVSEAIHELLMKRDGLILGICNGFQTLIRLGLVPFGKIIETYQNCPTLTLNRTGRLHSRMVRTRISSNKSPWLSDAKIGEIHTLPISHGAGRFDGDKKSVQELIDNGQITAQYVDLSDKPSMDVQYNPGGSLYAIESICSPDGRVLGKMAHSERISEGIYKNISGNKVQPIFENAVRYYNY